jgi:hypothetical protein
MDFPDLRRGELLRLKDFTLLPFFDANSAFWAAGSPALARAFDGIGMRFFHFEFRHAPNLLLPHPI